MNNTLDTLLLTYACETQLSQVGDIRKLYAMHQRTTRTSSTLSKLQLRKHTTRKKDQCEKRRYNSDYHSQSWNNYNPAQFPTQEALSKASKTLSITLVLELEYEERHHLLSVLIMVKEHRYVTLSSS